MAANGNMSPIARAELTQKVAEKISRSFRGAATPIDSAYVSESSELLEEQTSMTLSKVEDDSR